MAKFTPRQATRWPRGGLWILNWRSGYIPIAPWSVMMGDSPKTRCIFMGLAIWECIVANGRFASLLYLYNYMIYIRKRRISKQVNGWKVWVWFHSEKYPLLIKGWVTTKNCQTSLYFFKTNFQRRIAANWIEPLMIFRNPMITCDGCTKNLRKCVFLWSTSHSVIVTREKKRHIFFRKLLWLMRSNLKVLIMIQQVVAKKKKLLGVTPHGVESFFWKKHMISWWKRLLGTPKIEATATRMFCWMFCWKLVYIYIDGW